MRPLGIILAAILVCTIFAVQYSEAKPIPKNQVKKDLKEIKIPADSKSVKITMISKSRTLHVWHIVEVQVCAGTEKLYSPDLELSSDRDTIQVTMWGLIMPKSCKSGEFFIAANNPDTISVRFSSQTMREPAR